MIDNPTPAKLGALIMQNIKDNPPTWREHIEIWWNKITGKNKKFDKVLRECFKKGIFTPAEKGQSNE